MLKKFALDASHGLRSLVRGVDADWGFDERRRALRFPCRHRLDLYVEEKKSLTFALDYGMGGLRIAKPGGLKIGQRVKIGFPHPLPGFPISTIDCEVVWKRRNSKAMENLAGLRFVETKERMARSWVAYFFHERGAASVDLLERRKLVRSHCELQVCALSPGIQAVGTTSNIGLGGALLQLNRPAEAGERWGLTFAPGKHTNGFSVNGTVQSCEPGQDGLFAQRVQFDPPEEASRGDLMVLLLRLNRDFWSA